MVFVTYRLNVLIAVMTTNQDKRCEKFQINIEIKKLMTNSSLNVSEAKERRAGIVDLMKVLVFIGIFHVYFQIIAQIRIGHMH